jgi:hypothetical protein
VRVSGVRFPCPGRLGGGRVVLLYVVAFGVGAFGTGLVWLKLGGAACFGRQVGLTFFHILNAFSRPNSDFLNQYCNSFLSSRPRPVSEAAANCARLSASFLSYSWSSRLECILIVEGISS